MSKQQATPARGLSAILHGAAPHGPNLEHEISQLIAERQHNARDLDSGRIPTAELDRVPPPARPIDPLSPEAEAIISKGMIVAAEQAAREALEAANYYVADAAENLADVTGWAEALVRNARETAAAQAERHAAMVRSRPLFRQAMTGQAEVLPNPLPVRIEATPPDAA